MGGIVALPCAKSIPDKTMLPLLLLCSLLLYIHLLMEKCSGAILRLGNPLPWPQARPHLQYVRLSGVEQFKYQYNQCKGVEMSQFLWGDEVEYGIFKRTESIGGSFDLSLAAGTPTRLLLAELEKLYPDLPIGCEWQPEYGSWMVEAVPRNPYGSSISDLLNVERSMQLRRKRLNRALKEGEVAPSMSNFPMLGVEDYPHVTASTSVDEGQQTSDHLISASHYVSDAIINPHPRFGALTQNIRLRRGENVQVLVPKDTAFSVDPIASSSKKLSEMLLGSERCSDTTPKYPLINEDSSDIGNSLDKDDDYDDENSVTTDWSDYIHMDAMGFGMGCCCLQVTLQAENEPQSRFVYDQLNILSPLLLALSASTPIFKGQLAATDTRWDAITQAVDDRTPAERGVSLDCGYMNPPDACMAGSGVNPLRQSRYSESPLYIGQAQGPQEVAALEALNDVPVDLDEEVLGNLLRFTYPTASADSGSGSGFDSISNNGTVSQGQECEEEEVMPVMDTALARHIAHMFIRDPLVIFDDAIELDNTTATDHFDSIQSTNWRSMRWKPPSASVAVEHQKRLQRANKQSPPPNQQQQQQQQQQEQQQERDRSVPVEAPLQQFGAGWRIEFRTLELQLTDFENAAYAMMVILLARSILADGHNFYMPMSKLRENFRRSQMKDALTTQKFWMRKNSLYIDNPNYTYKVEEEKRTEVGNNCSSDRATAWRRQAVEGTEEPMELDISAKSRIQDGRQQQQRQQSYRIPDVNCRDGATVDYVDLVELSMDEIMNGQKPVSSSGGDNSADQQLFPGIIPQLRRFVQSQPCDDTQAAAQGIAPYLTLLSRRASGEIPTTARWIRDFVATHPSYQNKNITATTTSSTTSYENGNSSGSGGGGGGNGSGSGYLTRAVADDLVQLCDDIGMGRVQRPDLYGTRETPAAVATLSQQELAAARPSADTYQYPYQQQQHSDQKLLDHHDQEDIIIAPLEQLVEEDLMFSNYSCFIQRSSLPSPTGAEQMKVPLTPTPAVASDLTSSSSSSSSSSSGRRRKVSEDSEAALHTAALYADPAPVSATSSSSSSSSSNSTLFS